LSLVKPAALQPQIAYTQFAPTASQKSSWAKHHRRDSSVNLTSPMAKAQLNIFLDTALRAANLLPWVWPQIMGAKMQKARLVAAAPFA
jgi:hypothetical protein